jgi:hypothetical protein
MSEGGIERELKQQKKQLEWDAGILETIKTLTTIVEKHSNIINMLYARIKQLEEGAK